MLSQRITLQRMLGNRPNRSAPAALSTFFVAAILLLWGCGAEPEAQDSTIHEEPTLGHIEAPLVTNGDFESGNLNGWTVNTYLNPGLGAVPPTSLSELHLSSGGSNLTSAVGGVKETKIPAGLSEKSSLRYPKYGQWSAVVNNQGLNQNTNSLRQTFSITNADIDPADGKVHIRFAVAPVLENPGHAPNQQPYYYVVLRNVSRNKQLLSKFAYSNQPGVPWKTDPSSGVLYTDWQIFDVAPGSVDLDIGDQIELTVVAAGCSPGGHFGHIYVDSFGAFLPGLSIAASAPARANAGSNLTYTYLVKNSGPGAASNVIVEQPLPANTAFVGLNAPGATCTTPAVGATGKVSCNLGTVNPTASTTFQLTVKIASGATSTVSNGSYTVRADNFSPLIGPLVETTITQNVVYADLALKKSDGIAAISWGQPVQYTIEVTNNGPSAVVGARVTDTMPTQLTSVTWTCAASGGGACATSTGAGNIDMMVNLPVNAKTTLIVNATVISGSGNGRLSNLASVTVPSGVVDNDTTNNQDVDANSIGNLYRVTVNKDPAFNGAGRVVTSPAAINCDATCTSATAQFMDGTMVSVTATAAPGDTFVGWTGACTGTANPCNFIVTADTTITAQFRSPKAPNGRTCSSANDCLSGACVDGVCCNTACTEQCMACNVSGKIGTCAPVTGAPVGSRPACASDGSACGGRCDGTSSSCSYPTSSTLCRQASCAGNVETHAAFCDGNGVCPGATTATCDPFVCGANACLTRCTTFADCSTGNYCSAQGQCLFDAEAPVLLLPSSLVLEATGPVGALAHFTATAIDAVVGNVPVTCTPVSGTNFALGTTTVTCSADDGHGNQARETFTITVVDRTPPVITDVPADLTVEATDSSGAAVTFAVPNASDLVNGVVPVTCSPASGSTFALGTTTVTCSANDAHGNKAQATFSVTVRDTTPPALSNVPGPLTAEATSAAGATVIWASPSTDDLVSGSVPVTCSPASGSTFALGTTTVTCSANDAHGNTASASFPVTVLDTTPPTIIAVPISQVLEATGPNGAQTIFALPQANDLVDGAMAVNCTPASGSTVAIGQSTVTCKTMDAHGNSAVASFTVTVVDTTAPTLSNVPANIVAEATSAEGAKVVFTVPSAMDIVDGAVAVSCSALPGQQFPLGATLVTCGASDSSGNVVQASFTITVHDTTAPAVIVPAGLTVTATSASGAVATYTASATDAVSGSLTTTCTPVSGSLFIPGATTVTCKATDAAGNVGTATFKVNVVFSWSGLLQPVNVDGSSFKLGQTVPVKFMLTGVNAGITTLSARLFVAKVSNGVTGPMVEATATAASNSGNTFRYDTASGQYIFNLSTRGLTQGTWALLVGLGDDVLHTTYISLK